MSISPLVIPIVGIVAPFVVIPIAMSMRHKQRKREWEHLERMRSLELGLPIVQAQSGGGTTAIGAGVPIASFMMAFLTTVSPPTRAALDVPHVAIIWGTAMIVSVFAILIALILGIVQAKTYGKTLSSNQVAGAYSKPPFDPEAYEFAGHRV